MRPSAALLLILPSLMVATPASAGVATGTQRLESSYKSPDVVVTDVAYEAGTGEADDLTIRLDPEDYELELRDPAGISPGPGCHATDDPATVRCPGHPGEVMRVSLGDGDDRLAIVGQVQLALSGTIDGGPGDDRLEVAGSGSTVVIGGPGADALLAPTSLLYGGPGPDVLLGASVSYAGGAEPVSADLDGQANDGAAGEGDRIVPAEDPRYPSLVGGGGPDRLTGSLLDGGPGDDVLLGTERRDLVDGGPGADRLEGRGGDDELRASPPTAPAGSSPETVLGGAGADVLTGGPGADVLDPGPGRDEVSGLGGDDRIAARDDALDRIRCAPDGRPRAGEARVDRLDLVRGCTALARTGPGAPGIIQLGAPDFDLLGTLRISLGCSQDQPGGCPVRIRALAGRRLLTTRAASLRAGTARSFSLRVPDELLRRSDCGPRPLRVTVTTRTTAARRVVLRQRVRTRERGSCAPPPVAPEPVPGTDW